MPIEMTSTCPFPRLTALFLAVLLLGGLAATPGPSLAQDGDTPGFEGVERTGGGPRRASAESTPATIEYVVQGGDWVSKIVGRIYKEQATTRAERLRLIDAIIALNGLDEDATIRVGQRLRLPAPEDRSGPAPEPEAGPEEEPRAAPPTRKPGSLSAPSAEETPRQGGASPATVEYVVRPGDWVSKIAGRYYAGYATTRAERQRLISEIIALNGLDEEATIRVGQRLRLPARYEGQTREILTRRRTPLDAVARRYYGWTRDPAKWWVLIWEANRSAVGSPGDAVKARTTLLLPPVPTTEEERARLARQSFQKAYERFISLLDSGDRNAAAAEWLALEKGYVPLLAEEAPDGLEETRRKMDRAERRWALLTMEEDLQFLSSEEGQGLDPDAFVERVETLAERFERLDKAGTDLDGGGGVDPVVARIDAARQRLSESVKAYFEDRIGALASQADLASTSPPPPPERTRRARSQAFQLQYYLSRLNKRAPALGRDLVPGLSRKLSVVRTHIPKPESKLPAWTMQASRRQASTTIRSRWFKNAWLPLAAAYARGLWKDFPEVEDIWGDTVTQEDVIRAIIMHESRGIHHDGRGILQNDNGHSRDVGLGQINTSLHAGLRVNTAEMARVIDDPAWTTPRIANILGVQRGQWSRTITLDLEKPAHNLVAVVAILSYSMNQDYPETPTGTDKLVKSLSAYNHGAYSRDYRMSWLDYVQDVDPVKGESGRVSGVQYGIGMKFYLGLPTTDLEIDWWRRYKKLTLSQTFSRYVDPYYSYASYE